MEKLVRKAAGRIARRQGLTGEQEAVVAYGLLAFTQMLVILVLAALFGLLTGTLASCLTVCLGVGALRKFTGGAHARTMGGCIAVSLLTMAVMALLSEYLLVRFLPPAALCGVSLAAYFPAFLLVWKRAPVASEKKPIRSADKIRRLRRGALVLLTVCLLFTIALTAASVPGIRPPLLFLRIASALALAVLWQSLTLTRTVCRLFHNA